MAVQKKTWDEFRNTGLFHFVNAFLHIFGWVIVLAIKDNGEVAEVYPARTERSYAKLKYTAEHA